MIVLAIKRHAIARHGAATSTYRPLAERRIRRKIVVPRSVRVIRYSECFRETVAAA
jgi:hypothetical protein